MLQPNEIRINNWFHHTDNWSYRQPKSDYKEFDFAWEQSDWSALSECTLDLKDILPIKITDEWLAKFGIKGMNTKVLHGALKISRVAENEYTIHCSDLYHTITVQDLKCQVLKYVHQLQNLYFSLTGKELKIK